MDHRRRRPRGTAATVAAATVLAGGLTTLIVLAVMPRPVAHDAAIPAASEAPQPSAAEHRDRGFALWGVDHRGGPLRWDACAPVLFVLSTVAAPEHAERDLVEALAILSDASGLDLRLVGTTDERPARARPLVERDGAGWRWRPVLVAWDSPDATDVGLTALDRGVALPVSVRDGDREAFVTGQVVMNAQRSDLVPGFGDRRDAIGATLLHEIAHVLGLAHVDDGSQLMSEDPGAGPVTLGTGDRAGLRAIGAAAGCNPAPAAEAGRGLDAGR
jgi:hypothetical protein